jgi:hypothetical protein
MTFPPRPTFTVAVLVVALSAPAAAQDSPLVLQGVFPAGLRTQATTSWGTFQVTVSNPGSSARDARVLIFYPSRPDEQYGRDIWLPPRSSRTVLVPVGPAPDEESTIGREVQALLYDRTGGQDRLVLPPGEERVRSRVTPYRKREAATALVLDPSPDDESDRPADDAAILLAHTLRSAAGLPEQLAVLREAFLPTGVEAFDGVDHVILAGNRFAADPTGCAALRAWVERGGKLWVRLDLVDAENVASILGEDFGIRVIDRVGLTDVRLARTVEPPPTTGQLYEEPVDLVRVSLPADWTTLHTANGWPATFSRRLGRGKVVFTTLGARAWHRPRNAKDGKSPYDHLWALPVSLGPLGEVARELEVKEDPPPFSDADLMPLVTEQVGYSVVSRETVGGVLGAFVVAVLGAGAVARRAGRSDLAGWLAPGAAVVAVGVLVALGVGSRHASPPTVAVVELVDAAPGTGETSAHGLFAVYRPDSGPVPLRATGGGLLELNAEGLEGRIRRRVQTDLGAWHWEGLELPAGVRTGTFRASARPGPVTAVARFGPDGAEGTLTSPTFRNPSDGLVLIVGRQPSPVTFAADGKFTVGVDDLPAGEFIPGTVLTDRQQRRQAIYRKLLSNPLPRHVAERDLLLAWTDPEEVPFTTDDMVRNVGTALLSVPLEFRAPPPGTRVTVPAAFVPYRRLLNGRLITPALEADTQFELDLRFQLPASLVPLTVEKATLTARVRAPGRKVTLAGKDGGKKVVLAEENGPSEAMRVVINDVKLLRPDERGGLIVTLSFGEWDGLHNPWKIESMGLEVVGRTADR